MLGYYFVLGYYLFCKARSLSSSFALGWKAVQFSEGDFRFEYEYEIEYENDFSILFYSTLLASHHHNTYPFHPMNYPLCLKST